MKIGKVIQKIRKEKGITQNDFAKLCNISPTALSQIETDNSRPNQSTLDNICKSLDVPEALLYVLAIQEKDIPKEKLEFYHDFFPQIRSLLVKMLDSESQNPPQT